MDPRKLSFLQAVIGHDGARALTKATGHSTDLDWALFPRVIISWLEVAGHATEFADNLPGTGVAFSFRKHEDAFTGSIDLGDHVYKFHDATLYHVAGSVAVALGAAPETAPEMTHPALAKLGKSIDLLVRSRTLRKMQEKHAGGAKGAKPPGATAAPRPPMGPAGPVAVQPNQPSQVGTKTGTSNKPTKAAGSSPATSATPKLPGVRPPKKPLPGIKIGKAEIRACSACGGKQFTGDRYTGCLCFSDLSKSVKTTVVANSYLLEFGSGWTVDAITTLAENLGK
jgi:hypothetical protein